MQAGSDARSQRKVFRSPVLHIYTNVGPFPRGPEKPQTLEELTSTYYEISNSQTVANSDSQAPSGGKGLSVTLSALARNSAYYIVT